MGPINGRRLRLRLLAALALAGAAAVGSATAQPGKGPDYFNPKNFNPSMAIVMVVLVTAFFVLGFFSIYLRRCAGPPLGGPGPDDDDDDVHHYPLGLRRVTYASSRRTRGLDRAVLHAFPTMAYADVRAHKEAGKGAAALECAVCLCEFDDGDTLRLLLPRCAHAFHADCIDAWLASHVTCPVCRAVLAAAPATDHEHHRAIPPPVPAAAPPDQAAAAAAAGETETEDQRVRREEAAELMRIGSVKRALRTKSGSGRRPAPFPRSHTTGHSLADSDSERYTLRLPDHVLREAVAAANLRRSASAQAGGGGDGDGGTTTRRGFGVAGAASGRSVRLGSSGRWPHMSVLARTFSARVPLPAWGSARRGEADAPAKGAKFAGDDGKAAVEQCDGGACSLGAHV